MHAITRSALAAALAAGSLGAHAFTLVGIDSGTSLAMIDTNNVAAATKLSITGLGSDSLVGIDLRPSNGLVYGLGLSGKLYTLNTSTGVATLAATTTLALNPLRGYGVDFNPAADWAGTASLRVVSTSGENFAVNATSGAVAFSGTITNTAANDNSSALSGAAYTQSSTTGAAGAPTLYYIDSSTDALAKVQSGTFNAPVVAKVGSLGLGPDADVLKVSGFDIFYNPMATSNSAFAALNLDGATGKTGIYSIDLMTGQASMLGEYNGTLSGLTVSAVPEPQTVAMLLAGLAGLGLMSRRRQAR